MIRAIPLILLAGIAGAAPTPRDHADIAVTSSGFNPDNVVVPAGKPVTLVFTRKTDSTCAKTIVIAVDGKKIETALPLNKPVPVTVTFPKAGQITYACSMDMVKATVVVQ